jgi:site-specific recombinase XerD
MNSAEDPGELRPGGLKVLFGWLEEKGEITAAPMAQMKPPQVPDSPVPFLTDEQIRRLLGNCAG